MSASNPISRAHPRSRRADERGVGLLGYVAFLALIAIMCVSAVVYTGVSTNRAVAQSQTDTTTSTTSGCAAVYPDGVPTGPGYTFACYSPALGHGYNLP